MEMLEYSKDKSLCYEVIDKNIILNALNLC